VSDSIEQIASTEPKLERRRHADVNPRDCRR
jgi:hypothetical protein